MKSLLFFRTAIVLIATGCQLTSVSQVCTGSLGDPVVNVSFGAGPNPGTQLQAATTTYNFTSSTCPNDGSYTVVNSSSSCFNGSWQNIGEDHTPNDVNGYMMLVNASFTPGDFYVDTVRNLCANTTYEFAAWITNVQLPTSCNSNPILPKLIFNIETVSGTVLGTYSTGDIPPANAPAWKQYGLFFTTPINTNNIVIRLTNTAPGGCGNDLALDDITFRPCGPSIVTSLTGNGQTAADVCIGSIANIPMKAILGPGYASPSLQWQQSLNNGSTWTDIAGATSLNYNFTMAAIGTYQYRLTVADGSNIIISSCRVASNPVTITVHNLPVVGAGSNSPVCEKRTINLTATGGNTYAWSGPAGFTSLLATPSLIAQNNSAGQYNVIATDQFGCKNNTSVNVITNPKPLATVSSTQVFCEGNPINLQAGGGTMYQWSPAVGLSATDIFNPVANPMDTTIYSVVVFSANTCTDTATVQLNVIKKPVANAGHDKIILKGQSVILDGSASGSNISVVWTPATYLSNPLLIQPTATPLTDSRYVLQVTSNAGCGASTDEVFIKVYDDIYVPSAFSPNNNRLNDTWQIGALSAVPNARVIVYNRYGEVVFETTGNSKQWDGTYKGKPQPVGAYTYMIDLKNGRPLKKGTVMIIR